MPLIAIEGCDGGGKSTLLSQLRKLTISFWSISRAHRIQDAAELESFLGWLSAIPPRRTVMLDRHPLISESVYGELLRGTDLSKDLDQYLVASHYRRITTVIYCRPKILTIENNLLKTNQMPGVQESFIRLVMRYDNKMAELRMQGTEVIFYDYEDPESFKLIEEILTTRFLNKPEEQP